MLIAVTYVALAAIACARPADGWKDLLWFVNGFALLYATLAVGYLRRRHQAMASGFLLFAATYIALLWWSPATMPARQIVNAIGFDVSVSANQDAKLRSAMDQSTWELTVAVNAASDEYRKRVQEQYLKAQNRMAANWWNQSREETINAFIMMLAGLIGCLTGAHVWSKANRNVEV